VGSATATLDVGDLAVLATAAAAVYAGVTLGWQPLRAGRSIWIAGVAFLVWTAASLAYGKGLDGRYRLATHVVTYGKFAEYALLAPALPLLFRAVRDVRPFAFVLAVWSTAATAVGAAQFFGAPIFLKGTFGHRQASFLASADFAALSAAALVLGAVALILPGLTGRRIAWLAVVAGVLGVILAAALASILGLALAAAAALAVLAWRGLLSRRRALVAALVGIALLGAAAGVRHKDIAEYARFSSGNAHRTAGHVETYAQHELLAYIGWRIFADHPLAGVGFQGSSEQHRVRPYLADAHRRFPNESPEAFPSAAHPWGIQDLFLQVLADAGIVGLVLLALLYGSGLRAGAAASRVASLDAATPGTLGLLWLALTLGLWTSQGWLAGIGLDALTWWGCGFAATGAALARAVRG
jgi:O-antigen ligase